MSKQVLFEETVLLKNVMGYKPVHLSQGQFILLAESFCSQLRKYQFHCGILIHHVPMETGFNSQIQWQDKKADFVLIKNNPTFALPNELWLLVSILWK